MRVLVTGANGYLGPHVVESLTQKGHNVIALVRDSSQLENTDQIQFVQADILETSFSLADLIHEPIDAMVHLAWRNGFIHDDPSHFEELSGHYSFLLTAAKMGIEKITVLGSMHEVGYWEGPINSETPTNPISMYGIAKDALRRALERSLPEKTSLRWIRSFYITGDDRRSHSIFTKILEASQKGESLFPFNSGTSLYDFIDVSDLANQISLVTTAQNVPPLINCCSGKPESLGSRVERFIYENALKITLDYGVFPERPYDSPGIWGDASEINKLIAASGLQGK
jgi:dTDP-6-deoxy-L-talose 4-dehydrogenase (NAD+)